MTTAAADVTIRNNVIENFHELPITLDGVKGKSVVHNNVIIDGDETHSGDPGVQMFQIFETGWGLVLGGPTVDPAESTTIIRDNEIVSNHVVGDVFAVFDSDEVVIKDNVITLRRGAAFDVFALLATADSVIKDNEIEGSAPSLTVYLESDGVGSTGNLFKDNDTDDFVSSDVGFFADALSSANTTYLEEGQTYFDEVPGNNSWIIDDD